MLKQNKQKTLKNGLNAPDAFSCVGFQQKHIFSSKNDAQ